MNGIFSSTPCQSSIRLLVGTHLLLLVQAALVIWSASAPGAMQVLVILVFVLGLPPPEQAHAPVATAPVVAALTTFEGQAVFRVLAPGTPDFRAGHLFRFRRRSRTVEGSKP